MKLNKITLILLPLLIFNYNPVLAQNDLREDKPFFDNQILEYEAWLEEAGINELFEVDFTDVYADKLQVNLKSQYATDDSLKIAWKMLQEEYYKKKQGNIGEKMLENMAFLMDIGLDSVALVIQGRQFESTEIKIYFEGYVRVMENFPNVLSGGTIEIPLNKLRLGAYIRPISRSAQRVSVPEVRRALSDYILDYYKEKGTYWYKAHVDTSRNFYNRFVYVITCLNKEIISDGFYEYIWFKVEVVLQDSQLEVRYDIIGKYAPVLTCPRQREKFYKSIETHYPGKLKSYAEDMHARIENFLMGY